VGDADSVSPGFCERFHRSSPLPGTSVVEKIAEAICWGGKKENACTKEFASKILFLASAVSMVLYFPAAAFGSCPARR